MRRLLSVVVLILAVAAMAFAAQVPQTPIAGSSIPQFAQPLPLLAVQGGPLQVQIGNRPVTLHMCEFKSRILPDGAVAGYGGTYVWGYLAETGGLTTCSALVDFYSSHTGVLDTYLGPVFVNARNAGPTTITYVNDLGSAADTNVLAYRNSTDQTVHWADPSGLDCMDKMMPPAFGTPCANNYLGSIPAVAHLHGGEVPAEIDGGPTAWFTSDGKKHGANYYSFAGRSLGNAAKYAYPNLQDAAPIWFHDHTLGATRLNVFAGLAGGYYIYDDALSLPDGLGGLAGVANVIPLVLQDRMFDTNGQLFFPSASLGGTTWAPNPDHPYWVPEFIGDTIVVNGKAWPFLNVEQKRYRFLFLNGSNARSYEMFLTNTVTKVDGPAIYVIGTDGGYLDRPAVVPVGQHLRVMPGERYEIIIDFSGIPAGSKILLKNVAKAPYPSGDTATGPLGKVIEFRVGPCPDCPQNSIGYDPASGTPLRSDGQKIVRLVNPASGTLAVTPDLTRELTLNEIANDNGQFATDPSTGLTAFYEGGPLEILVNNTKFGADVTEQPNEGATELWEIVNLTADAHPIHTHLVQFQILNRQDFDVTGFNDAYGAAYNSGEYEPAAGPPLPYLPSLRSGFKYGGNPDVTPFLRNQPKAPFAYEAGWKDTAMMLPGQVTRIAVRWAPTSAPIAPASTLHFAFDPSGAGRWNYVWHCHIVDHEDNEMMRPDFVTSNTGVRTYVKKTNY